MVPPDSPITRPEDLAGQEIAVGYHSGSHFTTIQSLEAFLKREDIKLKFVGSVWARVDVGVDRDRAGDQRLGPDLSGAGSARLPQDRRLHRS